MSKVTKNPKMSKAIPIEPNERVYVGIDTHKRSHHVAIWSIERERVITQWVQPSDNKSLLERLEPMHNQIQKVVYEAGPTGFTLARTLKQSGFTVEVISAAHIPQPRTPDAKCDRIDCQKLAMYSAKGLLHPVRIPTLAEEQQRQVVRLREQSKRELKRMKQHIKSFLLYHGIQEPLGLRNWSSKAVEQLRSMNLEEDLRFTLDLYLEQLVQANSQIQRIEARMEQISHRSANKPIADVLRKTPGIGLVTTLTLLTEMPEPERFRTRCEVSKYQGLAPDVNSTGDKRSEAPLMKTGNRHLRRVLVEAAWQIIRRDPSAVERYRKLLHNCGNSKKAIVGVARWLGIVVWRMMTRKEPYRSEPMLHCQES